MKAEIKTRGRPQEIDKHFGMQLRKYRNLRAISQEELAKNLNISFQQIQKYEKGSNRISMGRIYDIARVLNIPIASFFEGIDSVSGKPDELTKLLQEVDGAIPLLRAYSKLSVQHRKRISSLINVMAELP